MTSKVQRTLEERVVCAAEAALADHNYVSALDILVGIGLLPAAHVRDWRQGRIACLEQAIEGNLHKISRSMHIFGEWALRGTDRARARQQVQPRIEEMLDTWRMSPESAVSSGAQGVCFRWTEQGVDEVEITDYH